MSDTVELTGNTDNTPTVPPECRQWIDFAYQWRVRNNRTQRAQVKRIFPRGSLPVHADRYRKAYWAQESP